ncbi:protein root UVB sensitive 2, chloroplastic [Canna indica]|uniref:Protein root UVB sensitive 2, chloroplastic n=1 Tax=Canna indica TaxID=4628 RepID=A0AAQ3Q9C2_9LILI|nr:protein root UVB sensitive 2, chloroplastic [Canna indica]
MDTILEKLKGPMKKSDGDLSRRPNFWIETSDSISQICSFDADGRLSVKIASDSRPIVQRMVESFVNKFFPSGYPYSVNEGYLTYTQFRALQHFSSAALSVLSTQSLLFAAGLRPTPAQATAVSWILKDGMQHAGKLICSNMGARMDSEPKSWRILADVLYDLGTGLEVISPLCPHLFLEMAGLGNFAKGMAVVAARATRLPIYSSFAKEGNLSDLFAKGEAISTLFNVVGIGAGIHLASTVCSSIQGKMIVAPLLSVIHIYSVVEEMRAAPVNTLNPQRTAMIVADYLKTGKVSSPVDLRYRENLLFPDRIIEEAGSVIVGQPLRKVAKKPSTLKELRDMFPDEKFLINRKEKQTYMVLEQSASGEDALRGWLVAALAADMENSGRGPALNAAFEKMDEIFPSFLSELKMRGWHTDQFLDGNGRRYAF